MTNGVTEFRLTSLRTAEGVTRLTFFSPGEIEMKPTRPMGGTGMRYVKARLEESFPGRWLLRDEPVTGGWQCVIDIAPNGKGRLT